MTSWKRLELAANARAAPVSVVSRRSRLAANAASNARLVEACCASPSARRSRARFEYATHATRAPPNAARRDSTSSATVSTSSASASLAVCVARRRSSASSSARPTARAAAAANTDGRCGSDDTVCVVNVRSPRGRDAATRAWTSAAAAAFASRLAKRADASTVSSTAASTVRRSSVLPRVRPAPPSVTSSARAQCSANVPRTSRGFVASDAPGGALERSTRASSQRHAPAASAAAASAAFSFSFSSSESPSVSPGPLSSARRRRDASDARSVSASAPRHARRSAARLRSTRSRKSSVVDLYASAPSAVHSARRPSMCETSAAPRAPRARCASHRFALVRRRASRRTNELRESARLDAGSDDACDVSSASAKRSTSVRRAGASKASNTSRIGSSVMPEPFASPKPSATSASWRVRRDAARERHAPRASSAVLARSPSVAKGSGILPTRARASPARAHLAGDG